MKRNSTQKKNKQETTTITTTTTNNKYITNTKYIIINRIDYLQPQITHFVLIECNFLLALEIYKTKKPATNVANLHLQMKNKTQQQNTKQIANIFNRLHWIKDVGKIKKNKTFGQEQRIEKEKKIILHMYN